MATYRFYPIDQTAHILGPGTNRDFDADALALLHAATLVDGHAIAVWDGARHVGEAQSGETLRHAVT